MIIAVVFLWALVLGVSPGLALIGSALALMIIDRGNPSLTDRLLGREVG